MAIIWTSVSYGRVNDASATPDPATWVEQHGDALFRYAMSRLNDATACEDIVQETLLAALSARHDYRGDAAERTWLIGILRHKLADHLRKRWREQPLGADDEGDAVVDGLFQANGHWKRAPRAWDGDAMAVAEQREFWAVFSRCRDALPARQAAAFVMRTVEDVPAEALCKELGISATNLWVMLHRARTRLRACLEANWFGTEPQP